MTGAFEHPYPLFLVFALPAAVAMRPPAPQAYRRALGGLFGGFVIGWVIDTFAGTSPWGLLVMLAFGIIVAFRSIIRMTSQRPN